tara:strand:- start:99 stop:677 length:579 start_codon:yes stop_codon:yes gene_type:complete
MLNNIIFTVIFFSILITVYVTFGIKQVVSNIYVLSVYSLIIATLFFTYVAQIEQYIVKSQVEHLLDEFTNDYKIFIGDDTGIVHVKDVTDKSQDDKVNINNDKLIKRSFLILGVSFAVGIIICISFWLITTKFFPKKSFNFKKLMIENSILLFIVVMVELLFFGLVTRNYKTLDINKTKTEMIETLISFKNS